MPKEYQIRSLEGIDWDVHYDHENKIDFKEHFQHRFIELGDSVMVEHKDECVLPLNDGEYCLTFKKEKENDGEVIFFMEEPFHLTECRLLFGDGFDYGVK